MTFTVIGVYPDREKFCDEVESRTAASAQEQVTQERPEGLIAAVIRGPVITGILGS